MNEDLDTVEDIAFAGVGVEGFVSRDLSVGVVVLHIIVVHDDRKSTAYDLIVYDYDDLPLGENAYQFVDLLWRPKDVASVGIDSGERGGQLVVIFTLQVAYLYFVDL